MRSAKSLKDGSSVNASALALIIRLPMEGFAAQWGISPQCMSLHSLPPLFRTMTGVVEKSVRERCYSVACTLVTRGRGSSELGYR